MLVVIHLSHKCLYIGSSGVHLSVYSSCGLTCRSQHFILRCFDAVGWMTGRIKSACKRFTFWETCHDLKYLAKIDWQISQIVVT